jgi:hypothetical protein
MEQEPPSKIDAPIISDVMIADQEPTVADLQMSKNFWQSHLPDGYHILSLEPDGPLHFGSIKLC